MAKQRQGSPDAHKDGSTRTVWEELHPDLYAQHPLGGVRLVVDGTKVVQEPLTAEEAARNLLDRAEGHIVVVGDAETGVVYLDNGTDLEVIDSDLAIRCACDRVGGLASVWSVTKGATPGMVRREVRRLARRYRALVTRTCWPEPDEDVLYRPSLQVGDAETGALDELVSRFTMESELDALLLKAVFVAAFYVKPGEVPLVVIVGRSGWGKSKIAETLSVLLDQSPIQTSIAMLDGKSRTPFEDSFLHETALSKSLAVMDNESGVVRSQALCRYVTSPTLTGAPKNQHVKERPNDVLNVMTTVGIRAGVEESRRMLFLRVGEPTYSTTWWKETAKFAREHREEIATDALMLLRRKPKWTDVSSGGFFPDFCMDVLSKCARSKAEYVSLLNTLRHRREVVDCSRDDAAGYRETLDGVIRQLLGDRQRPGVFHVAADVIEELFPRTASGSRNERLTEIVSHRDLADCCPIHEPVEFPSNGVGRRNGVVYLYDQPTMKDYNAAGGVTAVIRDVVGGRFQFGVTAKCRQVEPYLETKEAVRAS